jgi:hypothetical protein
MTIEGFSTTLDTVQKVFDQMMAHMSQSQGLEAMLLDSYNLFDASNTGSISVADLKEVGQVYGITALVGKKAETLLTKYDNDKNGLLSRLEFALLVQDPAIPGAMAVVLRAYAKKLAHISGNVAAARMRDEVVKAVVAYLELVCSKNTTKVGWVSEALTNGSLPIEFTADILKEMAMDMDNPAKLVSLEPGPILVRTMMEHNHDHVIKALTLMSDPSFWLNEGFDATDQPVVIERVTKWIVDAGSKVALLSTSTRHVHSRLYNLFNATGSQRQALESGAIEAMPATAARVMAARSQRHLAKQRAYRAQAHARLLASHSSRVLFTELYGGATAGSTVEDPQASAAVKSGVTAKPETLRFAQYLAQNSSATAKRLQTQCFEYMGDSSSKLDAFATQIQALIKKTQNFLNMMQQYSTPSGISKLEDMLTNFVKNSEMKVKKVVMDKVYNAKTWLDSLFDLPHALSLPASVHVAGSEDPGEIFMMLKKTLDQLQAALPEVIKDVKFAKKEVSAVSHQLHSMFSTFEEKAPPLFGDVSHLYKTLWTVYYVVFTALTLGVLFYGFWASGWFGGPESPENAAPEPRGFLDRCRLCCRACTACVSATHETQLCFWSCIIIAEVVVLILFIVAIVLTLLSGIKAFLSSGCQTIYFLSDDKVCHGILSVVKGFLLTFWDGAATQFTDVCTSESLLTCSLIQDGMMKSVAYTTVGSLVAALLSFQMIVNTAQLHEQVRWERVVERISDKDS